MQSCLSSPRSIISFLPIARSDFFYWELTQFCVKTCSSSGWWQSDTYCSNPELLPSANQTYPFISLERNELAESKDVEIVLKVLKSYFARPNRLNNAFEIGLDQMLQLFAEDRSNRSRLHICKSVNANLLPPLRYCGRR